jgi:acyl-[acyl carrier protein]--UDP-N-acetylglucosamine O-acyltransferase
MHKSVWINYYAKSIVKYFFLLSNIFFTYAQSAETISFLYKNYPSSPNAIGEARNSLGEIGELTIRKDGDKLYRSIRGSYKHDACGRIESPIEISSEKNFIVITENHPLRGCTLRYIINKDGSAGYSQELVSGVWKNQIFDRVLTLKNSVQFKILEQFAITTYPPDASFFDSSRVTKDSVLETQPPVITLAEQQPKAREQARLDQEAKIREQARLDQEAKIREQARLDQEAKIREQARLDQEAKIREQARLDQEAKIREQARLDQEAKIREQARLDQEAKIREQARLDQEAKAREQARLDQEAKIREQARLDQEAKAREQARLDQEATRLTSQKKKDEEIAKLQNELDQLKKQLSSSQNSGSRKALVIGNDNYKSVTKLQNAREDAKAIAEMLTSAGWKVSLKLDLSEKEMKTALRNFKNDVNPGDETTFFYAGHGVQFGTSNYLLPIDTSGDSEEQVKDDAIPLQRILDDMTEKKAKFTLALLDACRDNPFKVAGRSIGGGTRGLAPTSAATGQMVVFSAGTGQQALDNLGGADKNKNGLFTRIFLQEARKKGQPIDQIIKNVRSEVARLAQSVGHEQVPAIYDQVLGNFYFLK